MKKVVFSIIRLGKADDKKSGVGYIIDNQLVTATVSSNNKPYIRIYDCIKDCYLVPNTKDEYKGYYYELVNYNNQDIELNYYIWFKLIK